MSSTERDPRTDPRPGDIVSFREGDRRVVSVTDGWVIYELVGGGHLKLAAWQITCQFNCEVIHVADA